MPTEMITGRINCKMTASSSPVSLALLTSTVQSMLCALHYYLSFALPIICNYTMYSHVSNCLHIIIFTNSIHEQYHHMSAFKFLCVIPTGSQRYVYAQVCVHRSYDILLDFTTIL